MTVRRALGAREARVAWLVLREVLILVEAGAMLGLPAAWILARLLTSHLYLVAASGPPAYLLTLSALSMAALALRPSPCAAH